VGVLVGVAVRDEPADPLSLCEMIGSCRRDQRIGQDRLEGSTRDVARRERAIERVGGIAADRLETCRFEGGAIESSPGGWFFIARADPLLAKGLLAAGKQA